MKTTLLTIAGIGLFGLLAHGQQTSVNKHWQFSNVNLGSYEQIGTCACSGGRFIYFSNHKPSGNSDMSLNCISPSGSLAWQHNCNSSASADDYGSDVQVDNSGNAYVCGAKHNGSNLDYYIAKYSPSGSLIWSQTYNGTGNNDDAPSDITLDNSGNIYVTGTSYGTGMALTDVVTIKYNNTGVQQWVKRYNFGATPETGIAVRVDNFNNVIVAGSGVNNANDADFLILKYDQNGNQLGVLKHSSPGNGFDLPTDMILDNSNNIYLIGTSINGNNKNIKTLALNSMLGVLWVNYIDKSGNSDEGFGIELATPSEIAITGYSQKTNNGTDLVIYKYNASNGNTIWNYSRPAYVDNNIAKGRKIKKDGLGNLVVAGEIQKGFIRDMYLIAVNQSGSPIWEKQWNNGFGNNSARNLAISGNTVFVNGIAENGTSKQITTAEFTTDLFNNPTIQTSSSTSHVDDELIIQFDAAATILNNFQTKDIQFGTLPEFVQPYVIKRLDSIYPIEGTWANARARKVFMDMTTADTISLSRVDVWVEHKNLWPTLVVTAPIPSEQAAGDTISKLFPTVRYACKNNIYEFHSINPNDPFFQNNEQTGLTDPTFGINLPQAWAITTGASNIKVGVFDSGINYSHEDFGNGTFSGSKIAGGKDYISGNQISSIGQPDDVSHGTGCAGIIGALSNNNKGVSGITGGDGAQNNPGCTLYAMKIGNPSGLYPSSNIANAIVEGSMFNPNTNFGYGMHVQNHSWGGPDPDPAIQQAVETAWRNSSSFVASSGNTSASSSCATSACLNYPSSFDSRQTISVGASDATGNRAFFSKFDGSLDVIAPGVQTLYASLENNNSSGYAFNSDGTSFSAPHVTGVVGLMMSAHNKGMGAPANLAPEDVEYLLNNNATDVNTTGYDPETGNGRINAGQSVTKIQYPKYQIRHTPFQSANQTVGPPNQQIILLNNSNNVAAGVYFATRYQITWAIAEVFPTTTQIIDWWPRSSSEVGFNGTNPCSGQEDVQYSVLASGPNFMIMNATAFCYNITMNILSQSMNAWIPTTPNNLRHALSIYAFDPTTPGFKENELPDYNFNLYPNPTNNFLNIVCNESLGESVTVEITDASGKLIASLPFKNNNAQNISINMSHLSAGVYFCKVSSNNYSYVKKFVKID
jgi:subtilisin family serine protease